MKLRGFTAAAVAVLLASALSTAVAGGATVEGNTVANEKTSSGPVVRVGRSNGRTAVFVDGKPIPGVAILAPVRGDDEKATSSLSTGMNSGIRIALVALGGDWTGPDRWNMTGAVRHLELAARRAPDAWLVPRICLDAPAWWLEANPTERAWNSGGTGPEMYASMGSAKWIADSSAFLAATVRALESSPVGNRIIGYSLLCSHGGEWIYTGAGAGRLGDYGEPSLRYYRAWLQKRYGSQPWIANAGIPSEEDRGRSLPEFLRDPVRDARAVDFDLAFSDMAADNILAWCRAVKQASGGNKLIGVFYGYLLWQTGLVNSLATNGHLALRRLIDSPDIDFITSFPSYDVREPGAAAPILIPVESIQAAGKLVFNECDNRTHLVGGTPPVRFHLARDQRDPANGPQLWSGMWNIWGVENAGIAIDVLRREFAQHLIRGSAWWWFDMTGGWYSCQEIEEEFRRQTKIAADAMQWDMSSISEVAGIVSGESCARHSMMRMFDVDPQASLVELQADMSTREMYKAGAPVDWWMPEDLARPEMQQYKVLYFHNATFLTDAQRKAIEELKRGGRTMVFVGYPGLVAGATLDVEAASRTTGIKLKLVHTRGAARLPIDDYNLPCMQEATAQMVLGSGAIVSPRLIVDDPGAQVIARWPDGSPAAAVKQHKDWTAYYFPVPPNNAQLFRAVFKNAGCHIYTHNTCRDVVYANRSLLAIHSNHYGQTVRLPKPARVTDLFTGAVMVENSDTINLGRSWNWNTGTRVFRIEYR